MKCKPWKALVPLMLSLACVGMGIFAASKLFKQDDLPQDLYRVYVNDKAVDYHARRSESSPYIMLPVLLLAESLGETVTWKSDTVAHLTRSDGTWEFDVESGCLTPLGSSSNLLCPPPGYIGIWTEKTDRDAYVDLRSLQLVLCEYFGVKNVEVNDRQRVVRITYTWR